MSNSIKLFKDIAPDDLASAGGKGGTLARVYQAGYPVPNGFIIFPQAFTEDVLDDSPKEKVKYLLNVMRKKYPNARFAVRSSATAEDSARASFAGQFETVLNAKADEEVLGAILKVRQSGKTKRVQAYNSIQKNRKTQEIAVVVQIMIPSEISGVLFTADPVTGNFALMVGNYVRGTGEQLVSGETNAEKFTFARSSGIYNGPDKFKKYASLLYKLAVKIERDFGTPQDIEWTLANGNLYILQARPITTLSPDNYNTYEINDSLAGDFLWTNTNVGEALTDVFAPLSWSMLRKLDKEQERLPGHYLFSGNICGRIYSNTNLLLSLMPTFGIGTKWMSKLVEEIFGGMPKGMVVPVYPFQKLSLLKFIISRAPRGIIWFWKTHFTLSAYLRDTPNWCSQITQRIIKTKTAEELLEIWRNDLWPHNILAMQMTLSATDELLLASKLRKELIALMGQADASTLLSNFRGDVGLESLGPVTGLSKVIKGEMHREEYLSRYGHRGPHEFELLIADSQEDPRQFDRNIDDIKATSIDTETLLEKQRLQYEETKKKLAEHFPKQIKSIEKRLGNIAESARRRELVRSEWTRVFRVNRTFALKAGSLSGIGDDVFFLYIDEVLALLSGDHSGLRYVPARKNNYKRFKDLPPFPPFIRGRFDPFIWVKDSNRRNDYYDPTTPTAVIDNSMVLKGFAGATGRIKGTVRVLIDPEEGEKLKLGEILVTTTTNIGWTPLFLKASAIITDIGAPLSHAAIVARELGIPAVVGCGNATARLKTGDCVIVDGGQGVVEIQK